MNNNIAKIGEFVTYNGYSGEMYSKDVKSRISEYIKQDRFYEVINREINYSNIKGNDWYYLLDSPSCLSYNWFPCKSFDANNRNYMISKYGLK